VSLFEDILNSDETQFPFFQHSKQLDTRRHGQVYVGQVYRQLVMSYDHCLPDRDCKMILIRICIPVGDVKIFKNNCVLDYEI